MSFQNFEQIINLKVRITNLLDQIIIGQIYTYSSSNEVIILKTIDKKEGPSTYRIINTSFIKSIQVLPPFNKKNLSNQKDNSVFPKITVDDLKKNLEFQISNYNPESVTGQEAAKQGSSQSSQSSGKSNIPNLLFNKLVKLYGEKNVRFNGNGKQNEIIVYEEIKIIKPFTNNKSNIQLMRDNGSKKHLDSVQRALKQFWLEIDNEKRGG